MSPNIIVEIVKNDVLFWGLNASDIASLLGVMISLITVIYTLKKYGNDRNKEQQLDAKKELNFLKENIDKKIEQFYGPIIELREESKILYNLFAIDLKAKEKANGNYFRTIKFLCFAENKLRSSDEAL